MGLYGGRELWSGLPLPHPVSLHQKPQKGEKRVCMWERGRKTGFALCKPCIKFDHCHQQWLMALLLHVNTVTGWKLQGMKRGDVNLVAFFPRAEVFLLSSKLKIKTGHSLELQILNHLLYFMTTKFKVVDTPHQHPAVFSLACYINQMLCFLHDQTTHQSCIDFWGSHNMDTREESAGRLHGGCDGVYMYLRACPCVYVMSSDTSCVWEFSFSAAKSFELHDRVLLMDCVVISDPVFSGTFENVAINNLVIASLKDRV